MSLAFADFKHGKVNVAGGSVGRGSLWCYCTDGHNTPCSGIASLRGSQNAIRS
jgi:hypothetical protein